MLMIFMCINHFRHFFSCNRKIRMLFVFQDAIGHISRSTFYRNQILCTAVIPRPGKVKRKIGKHGKTYLLKT